MTVSDDDKFLEEMRDHVIEARRTQYAWMLQWAEETRGAAREIDHATKADDLIQNVHTPLGRVYYLAARLPQCCYADGRYLAEEADRWRAELYTMADMLTGVLTDVHRMHRQGITYGTPEWDVDRGTIRTYVGIVARGLEAVARRWVDAYPECLPLQ